MLFLGIFLLELIGLFMVSHILSTLLYLFFYSITRSQKGAIYGMAILFFPGVLVHELAHALVASLLLVRVGDIEFFPTVIGDKIKLGSVQVAKSDFIRRFLIGVAPVIVGAVLIFSIFWAYFSIAFPFPMYLKALITIGLLFEVSNTMFSSSKDLEGASVFVVLFLAVLAGLFFVFRPSIESIAIFFNSFERYFRQAALVIAIPLGIDVVLCLAARALLRKRRNRY